MGGEGIDEGVLSFGSVIGGALGCTLSGLPHSLSRQKIPTPDLRHSSALAWMS